MSWILLAVGMAVVAFLHRQAHAAGTKVACVGDSITAGYTIADASQHYPEQLGKMLGSGWQVGNFGESGRTLLRVGDWQYIASAGYKNSDAFKPDVVVIMLGTNDAKPENWQGGARKAAFEKDYKSLIEHYAALPSHPRVFIATTCPAFADGKFGIGQKTVNDEIVPLIRKIANDNGVPLIDVYAALVNRGSLFTDGIHPNPAGATIIASTVRAALAVSAADAGAPDATAPREAGAPEAPVARDALPDVAPAPAGKNDASAEEGETPRAGSAGHDAGPVVTPADARGGEAREDMAAPVVDEPSRPSSRAGGGCAIAGGREHGGRSGPPSGLPLVAFAAVVCLRRRRPAWFRATLLALATSLFTGSGCDRSRDPVTEEPPPADGASVPGRGETMQTRDAGSEDVANVGRADAGRELGADREGADGGPVFGAPDALAAAEAGRPDSKTAEDASRADAGAAATYHPCPPLKTDPCRVMPLGDSITSGAGDDGGGGYRTPLWQWAMGIGRKIDFVGSLAAGPSSIDRDHEGHYGSSIDGLNGGIVGWLRTAKPHVVLLMIGTNDRSGTPEAARTRLARLIDTILTMTPDAALVVAGITPIRDAREDQYAVAYNKLIKLLVADRAAQGKHISFVDMHDALMMPKDFSDGLHPNAAGYKKMVAVWSAPLGPLIAGP